MAAKLALFEFINEDSALEIGDSSRIVGVKRDLLRNESWDTNAVCEVRWPGKKGRIDIVAAKILRFGDERSELKAVLDRVMNGEDIADIEKNLGNLGRGQRAKRTAKRQSITSDDEQEDVVNTSIPKNNKKIRLASEKRAEKDILAVLKERNQIEMTNEEENAQPTIEDLWKEMQTLKKSVKELKESNNSLQIQNQSLLSAMAKLTGIPGAIENLTKMVSAIGDTPISLNPSPPTQPLSPLSIQPSPTLNCFPVQPPSPQPLSPLVLQLSPPLYPPRQIQHIQTEQEENVADSNLSAEANSMFSIPQRLLNQSSKTDARKLTNEILHGLYSREFLATHSVSGGKRAGGLPTKPAMDPAEVTEITRVVLKYFPEKKPADIHHYMREKLSNAAKSQKRLGIQF